MGIHHNPKRSLRSLPKRIQLGRGANEQGVAGNRGSRDDEAVDAAFEISDEPVPLRLGNEAAFVAVIGGEEIFEEGFLRLRFRDFAVMIRVTGEQLFAGGDLQPKRTQYTGGNSALRRLQESPPFSLIQTEPVVLPKASVRPSPVTSRQWRKTR